MKAVFKPVVAMSLMGARLMARPLPQSLGMVIQAPFPSPLMTGGMNVGNQSKYFPMAAKGHEIGNIKKVVK